jgi:tetratricopeptide (TPR) repeat protein
MEAIETIPRRGYRFVAPVIRREIARPEPAAARRPAPSARWRGLAIAASFALIAVFGGTKLASGIAPGDATSSNVAAQNTRLYTIGRYYWNLRTKDGIAKSVEYFSRIVASDPHDARGYAGLALANAIMADYGYGNAPAKINIARARAYARKALSYDPNDGDAYAVLGMIASGTMKATPAQIARALADLRRAIALDPSSGSAHEWYGIALLQQGHVSESYTELERAAQLDPLSVATAAWLGTTAYLERHYGDAIAYAQETLDLSPQRPDAYETLGLAYEALGDDARAKATFHRMSVACAKCAPQAAALLAPLLARENRMAEARAQLAIAEHHAKEVAPQDLAVAFAAVGDRETALTWLRRSRLDDDYAAAYIAHDPRFAGLRKIAKSGA